MTRSARARQIINATAGHLLRLPKEPYHREIVAGKHDTVYNGGEHADMTDGNVPLTQRAPFNRMARASC